MQTRMFRTGPRTSKLHWEVLGRVLVNLKYKHSMLLITKYLNRICPRTSKPRCLRVFLAGAQGAFRRCRVSSPAPRKGMPRTVRSPQAPRADALRGSGTGSGLQPAFLRRNCDTGDLAQRLVRITWLRPGRKRFLHRPEGPSSRFQDRALRFKAARLREEPRSGFVPHLLLLAALVAAAPFPFSAEASFDPDGDPDLTMHFTFDTTRSDASGNQDSLPESDSWSFGMDRFRATGRAAAMEDGTVFIEAPRLPGPATEAFTTAFWFRIEDLESVFQTLNMIFSGPIVLVVAPDNQLNIDLYITEGGFTAYSIPIEEERWMHFVLTSDGQTARFYVDGIERITHTIDEGEFFDPFSGSGDPALLALANRTGLGIHYDELRVYRRALDAGEVAALYAHEQFGPTVATGVERALAMIIETEVGKAYQPQRAPEPSGPWSNFGQPINGNGEAIAVFDRLDADRRFYRALEGPTPLKPPES